MSFLLRHQPEQFKRVGRTEYAHCGHDSLKVSSNGKWNWHSRGVGGTTAVQYLIKVEGYDFVRAVQIVCADAPFLSSPPVIGEKNSGFALPLRGDSFKAYQYLAGRGICDEVLAFCFHTGRVYCEAWKQSRYGAAFCLYFKVEKYCCQWKYVSGFFNQFVWYVSFRQVKDSACAVLASTAFVSTNARLLGSKLPKTLRTIESMR